jgi:transposase InsO family protein
MTTARPLEMLHIDLFGPIAYVSIGGNKCGLVIVDDYSHFTWVIFLQDKSETQEVLKKFLKRAQNEFDAKVKKIRSDNGTEFKNNQVEDFLDEEGINMSFWSPTLLNKMGWSNERTVLSQRWQEACMMNTRHETGFGWRQSTGHVTPLTIFTYTRS